MRWIGCSPCYIMQTRSKTKAEKERRAAQFLCGIVEGMRENESLAVYSTIFWFI